MRLIASLPLATMLATPATAQTSQNVNAELALNSTECVRTAQHFGYETVINICTGARTTVEWGGVDWAACIGMIGFGLAAITIFMGIAVSIWRGY